MCGVNGASAFECQDLDELGQEERHPVRKLMGRGERSSSGRDLLPRLLDDLFSVSRDELLEVHYPPLSEISKHHTPTLSKGKELASKST